jgi:3-deoxy-D-manno-octulosonic-acid transferase
MKANTYVLILYRVIYVLAFCALLPRLVWKCIRGHRTWRGLFNRICPPARLEKFDGKVVWVHAVSVGEVIAVAPIVQQLQQKRPSWRFVVSTITETGLNTAKRLLPTASEHLLLSFDFLSSVRRLLRNRDPFLVILSEGDGWPVFLDEAKKKNAFIVTVNGKISRKSMSRLSLLCRFSSWIYSFVDLFCLQDYLFYRRFSGLGVDEKRLCVCGNTKADLEVNILTEEEIQRWKEKLHIRTGDQIIVLGSTHAPEEERLLKALLPVLHERSNVKVIIAPRHPERFAEVYSTLHELGISAVWPHESSGMWNVMVMNQLGVLAQLYQLATIAIVCGSFIKRVGGHNIVEPAAVGVPVIVGPYMHSQSFFFESACEQKAVVQVQLSQLDAVVTNFLDNEEERKEQSKRSLSWASSLRGATERTVEAILSRSKD